MFKRTQITIRTCMQLTAMLLGFNSVQAATIAVACPGQAIQAAVDSAQPGDVINVSGNCTENVIIRNEKSRFTLDGQGLTTVYGSAGSSVITVRGKGIVVKRFTISGGAVGIYVNRGANATLDGNDISQAATDGIVVSELSNAVITGNIIHDNLRHGIQILQNSTARIGFSSYSDAVSPNVIQNNGRRGIHIIRASSAAIVGNTISNNGGDGIGVFRLSEADIASNAINGNGGSQSGNGINVSQNSSIQLGEDSLATAYDMPNTTSINNNQYGIRCSLGGNVYGHIGSTNQLNGAVSQLGGGATVNTLSGSCPFFLITP